MISRAYNLSRFARLVFALTLLLSGAVQPSDAQSGASAGVCVVAVKTRGGQVVGTAGKGFAANVGGRNVLVTTAHGLSQLVGSEDIETNLANMGSLTMMNFAGQEIGTAGQCVLHRSGGLDLLMFELPTGVMQPFSLSQDLPAPGAHVFVLSKNGENFSSTAAVDKFAGTVAQSSSNTFNVRMDGRLSALHSSGSAVIDERGNVVGMLIGVSANRDYIECIPATAIQQSLNPHAQVSRARPAAAGARGYGTPRAYTQTFAPSVGNGVRTYGTLAPKYRNKP
ncbi:MAG TPA: hypothetical protein V6D22_15225 [Candidatus Obscuribacterales bacterium]